MKRLILGSFVFMGMVFGLSYSDFVSAQEKDQPKKDEKKKDEKKKDDKKVATIKQVMTKACNAKMGLIAVIGKDVSSDKIDWTQVSTKAKELTACVSNLSANTPKKGEKESWDKLVTAFIDHSKSLEAGAEKKDVEVVKMEQKAMAGSCGGCHKVHK